MNVFAKMAKIIGGLLFILGIAGGIVGSFDYVIKFKGQELPLLDWTGAIIVSLIGAVFYGIGYWLTKKFGDIDTVETAQPKLDMADLGFIVKALKKTRKRSLFMGVFMILFGLPMLIFPAQMNEGTGVTIGLAIFGAICLLIGIMGFVQYNKLKNIETSEIYKLIMYTPQKITGLTVQIITSGYGKVGQAINATIVVDKKNKGVLSITENDLELLKQYLLKHNPSLEFDSKTQQA